MNNTLATTAIAVSLLAGGGDYYTESPDLYMVDLKATESIVVGTDLTTGPHLFLTPQAIRLSSSGRNETYMLAVTPEGLKVGHFINGEMVGITVLLPADFRNAETKP